MVAWQIRKPRNTKLLWGISSDARALIARDLADASLAGLSADRRFATAYNAALQAANMAIACAGYKDREQGWTPPRVLGDHEIGVG
jgi:hypothetical protein